jgi:LPXTG-site transpeptidase (sortase) family protein
VPTPAPTPVRTPTRLEIPSIRVSMPLRPVALDRLGAMELPASPQLAGWYRFGPAPGSHSGAAVLAAHVDMPRAGVGPLAALVQLDVGAEVVVRAGSVTYRYRVVTVRRIDKARLDLDSLFSRDGPPRLHIVTCGGAFDPRARHYADNVVAIAVPE